MDSGERDFPAVGQPRPKGLGYEVQSFLSLFDFWFVVGCFRVLIANVRSARTGFIPVVAKDGAGAPSLREFGIRGRCWRTIATCVWDKGTVLAHPWFVAERLRAWTARKSGQDFANLPDRRDSERIRIQIGKGS